MNEVQPTHCMARRSQRPILLLLSKHFVTGLVLPLSFVELHKEGSWSEFFPPPQEQQGPVEIHICLLFIDSITNFHKLRQHFSLHFIHWSSGPYNRTVLLLEAERRIHLLSLLPTKAMSILASWPLHHTNLWFCHNADSYLMTSCLQKHSDFGGPTLINPGNHPLLDLYMIT